MKEKQAHSTAKEASLAVEERRGKKSWAMRLKRVFNIDITVCRHCQGAVRIIACIEDRQVIKQILSHIKNQGDSFVPVTGSSGIRGPPNNTIFQYPNISGETEGRRKMSGR